MKTKEQQRSAFALQQIEQVFGIPVDEKIANFVVGVPTMVLANGLGQTLAFLLSKRKDEHNNTCKILREWLGREMPVLKTQDTSAFLQALSRLEQRDYLHAQQEALALLQWLKRYSRAFQKEVPRP